MAVVFNLATFSVRYPAYAAFDPALLNELFNEACVCCDNTDSSLITNEATRGVILNALVAHLCELTTTQLVGRVSTLNTFGIVASHAYAPAIGTQAWYDQTPHGAKAWMMMAPYRTAIYVVPDE